MTVLKPMLCASADVPPTGDQWVAEPKLDGWRLLAHVTADRKVRLFAGRNGSAYTGQLPYLAADLCGLPPDTILDGELVGNDWNQVQSVMTGAHPHKPHPHDPALTYVVFDVLRFDTVDVRTDTWDDRRLLVKDMVGAHVRPSVTFASTELALELALSHGFEGIVCKRRDSRYVNTRSASWVKIKPQLTAEATVVGFKPGQGKFASMVGALELEMVESGARTRCSGFDDATRREMTDNPGRWLGTVIEIRHHGLGRDGTPRHPQFHRRRDDMTTAPARPVRTAPTPKERPVGGPSGRNYRAMKDPKLLRCIEELRNRNGDAYQRVIAKIADPDADLAIAEAEAQARQLIAA